MNLVVPFQTATTWYHWLAFTAPVFRSLLEFHSPLAVVKENSLAGVKNIANVTWVESPNLSVTTFQST